MASVRVGVSVYARNMGGFGWVVQVRQWGRVLVRKIQGNRTVIQNPLEHLDQSGPSGTWRSCEPQEHVTSLKDQWARGSHRSRRTSLRCEINSHRHRPPSNRHPFSADGSYETEKEMECTFQFPGDDIANLRKRSPQGGGTGVGGWRGRWLFFVGPKNGKVI